MHIAHKTAYVLLALSVAGIYWLTLPPDLIEFDSACKITSPGQLSALLHPRGFWQKQLDVAEAALDWEQRMPQALAQEEATAQANATSTEAVLDRLSQQAAASAEAKRPEQIAWLERCTAEFKQKLGE